MPTLTYTDPFQLAPVNRVSVFYSDHTPNSVGTGLDESYAVDAAKVTRLLQCPWPQRYQFVKGLLGFPYVDFALKHDNTKFNILRRLLPLAYPFTATDTGLPYLFATSVTKTDGVGPIGKDASGLPNYQTARLTVNFTSPLYDILADNAPSPSTFSDNRGGLFYDEGQAVALSSGAARYVIRYFQPANRAQKLTQGLLRFTDDTSPTPVPITRVVSGMTVKYQWMQVPEAIYPKTFVQNSLGTLNVSTFDGFPPGTLRFDSVDLKRGRSPFGGRIYESVEYAMRAEFNVGVAGMLTQNHLPKVAGGQLTFVLATSDGTVNGDPLFRSSDFSHLFKADGAPP